jgi:hypothetical protein
VAVAINHRRVGDRIYVKGGGVGEEAVMVLQRSRRMGGRYCRSHDLVYEVCERI